ncbi:MAG: flavin reductase family protein [Thermaceae bacterium]|nr:flavin reductase family protein [Thermaceae bacterium]
METTQPNLTDRFKIALSRWASGVTVIAAEWDGERRGMTASSFSSVSLEPPLVLVCVDENAHIMGILEHTHRFTVNILAEGQDLVSTHFAGKPVPDLEPLQPDLSIEGSLATLFCSRWQLYPGGDHRIVVGLVEDIRLGEPGTPLGYWQRSYRRVV